VLNQFKEDTTAWTHCDKILNSKFASVDTKFIALNILTEAINVREFLGNSIETMEHFQRGAETLGPPIPGADVLGTGLPESPGKPDSPLSH